MRIPARLLEQIVEHALSEAPREACGLVGSKEDLACRVCRIENIAEEPEARFLMDRQAQYDAMSRMESDGLDLAAIYHSHPDGPASLSAEDARLALYPQPLYIVVSLEGETPQVVAFAVRDKHVTRVEVEVC